MASSCQHKAPALGCAGTMAGPSSLWDWQSGNMLGTCSPCCLWLLRVLLTGFTARPKGSLNVVLPCPLMKGSMQLHWREEGICRASLLTFHMNQVTVINCSVSCSQVPGSSALTGATLNVFNFQSQAKKSINVNTSYEACILKPSTEHLQANRSADFCQATLESLLGCICPGK